MRITSRVLNESKAKRRLKKLKSKTDANNPRLGNGLTSNEYNEMVKLQNFLKNLNK